MASRRTPFLFRLLSRLSFRFDLLLVAFFPRAFWRFDDQTFFDCARGDADIAHFAIDDGFDALKIREETAFGDGRHVRADTAFFLRFTTAPDVAAFDWANAS